VSRSRSRRSAPSSSQQAASPLKNKASAPARSPGSRWAPLAVVLAAILSSIPTLANQFTSDDIPLIRDNAIVHSLANLDAIFTSPYWPPPAPPDLYRPVASVINALEWIVGGGSPTLFRIVSVALYALAAVAVLRLAQRVTSLAIALAVALLFAAHPVHVEAVALGVNQGEIIVGIVVTLLVTLYVDRRRENRLSIGTWVAIVIGYGAAALVKEHALVLPAVLIASELLLVPGHALSTRVRSLWMGYAAMALAAAFVLLARSSVLSGDVAGSFTAEALVGLGPGRRALTMLHVVPHWFRLLIWPAHLRIDYSPGEFVASQAFGPSEMTGFLLVVAVIATIGATWRRAPVVAFGLSWMAISLIPVSNLFVPTGILIAERTLFLPSVGWLIAIGGAADLGWKLARTPSYARVATIAVAALIVAGVARSASRHRIWHDPTTLALASVIDAPRSWRVQRAYAEALFDASRSREAIEAYERALQWAPQPWFLRNSLSRRLRLLGNDSGAVEQLRASLRQQPSQREATAELVAALLGIGEYAEGRRVADSVIVADGAPPIMVGLRKVADSAIVLRAPPGTVRVGVRGR
jgi:hypothetical protein